MIDPSRPQLELSSPWCLFGAALMLASCTTPFTWIAEHSQPPARAPQAPDHCEAAELGFDGGDRALLGGKATQFWQWAREEFPNNIRLGHSGRMALMPNSSPGIAMHVNIQDGIVASLLVQSYASSAAHAQPLSRQAVSHFLHQATGCRSYKLCQARANIDGIRFQGYTTCAQAHVPIKLVTPSRGRSVISVAVWMPSFAPTTANRISQGLNSTWNAPP